MNALPFRFLVIRRAFIAHLAALLSLLGAAAPAQTYKILHHFTGVTFVRPRPLVASGQTLFGATGYGGAGSGSVFKLTMDGSGFETLRAFNSPEGGVPIGSLVLSGSAL